MAKRTKSIEAMIGKVEEIKDYLDTMATDRQEKFDNRSEKWQEGEKGEAEAEFISNIEEARDEAESLVDKLTELFPEE